MRPSLAVALLTLLLAAGCGSPAPTPEGGGPAPAPAPAETPAAASWTQAGADAARTRSVADPGPENEAVLRWTGLIDPLMATEPVIASTTGGPVVLVGGPSNLRALNAADGHERWEALIPGAVARAPATWGDKLFVSTLDGLAELLATESGSQLAEFEGDFPLEAPPLVIDGLLVFEETAMTSDKKSSRIHALAADTLEPRWTHDFAGGGGSPPATDGERVFVHASAGVLALSLKDGGLVWRWEREAHRQLLGPAVAGGRVVVHSSKRPPFGMLTVLDAATGELQWEEALKHRFAASPALTETELVATVLPDRAAARDAATGELKWDVQLPGPVISAPVLTPKRVYCGGEGFVAGLDRATGRLEWSVPVEGEVTGLSVLGDELYAATLAGFVHAIGPAP